MTESFVAGLPTRRRDGMGPPKGKIQKDDTEVVPHKEEVNKPGEGPEFRRKPGLSCR